MKIYNKYIKHLKNTTAGRDYIFEYCLSLFDNKPISVLEIGASRNISDDARFGDGWSSIFWALYIEKYGGRLKILDTSNVALGNCKHLLEGLTIDIDFINTDANEYIKNIGKTEYDLVYLDGSNNPHEMLLQFEQIDRKHSIILCDDFNVKGFVLRKKYTDYKLMYLTGTKFEMALYNKTT